MGQSISNAAKGDAVIASIVNATLMIVRKDVISFIYPYVWEVWIIGVIHQPVCDVVDFNEVSLPSCGLNRDSVVICVVGMTFG